MESMVPEKPQPEAKESSEQDTRLPFKPEALGRKLQSYYKWEVV